MIRTLIQALVWAFIPLLTACTSHQHESFNGDPAAGYYALPVASRDSIFDYRAPPPRAETFDIPVRKVPGYDVSGIRFPSTAYNGQPGNQVEARYFKSQRGIDKPKPLLIVMPIWDTHTFPSTIVAHGYPVHSGGSVNILWMQGDGPLFDWFHLADIENEDEFVAEIDRSVERFRTVTVDTRRLLDWAEMQPEIDANRIGIIGFSMSALVAANVAGTDPRIHTGVYMVGGARPWDVMSYCSVVVAYMRDNVKENLGWSQEQFRQFFHAKLEEGDPALWHGRFRSESSLIIDAEKDDCMPPESREVLWQAMGRPERILFPYNHWQPFLALTPVGNKVLTRDIYEFLDRKLLAPPTRREASAGDYIPTVASESH